MDDNTTVSSVSAPSTCKRCKSKVASGIKCIICKRMFHNSCAKKMANIVNIDEHTVKCCEIQDDIVNDEASITTEAFFEAINDNVDGNNKIDLRIFKYVVKQKDDVIRQLEERIKLLETRTEFVTRNNEVNVSEQQTVIHNTNQMNIQNKEQKVNYVKKGHMKISSAENVGNFGNSVSVSADMEHGELVNVPGENTKFQVKNGEKDDTKSSWVEIVRKRNRPVVIGSNEVTSNNSKLKGIPKMVSFHVYRFAPTTTVEEVLSYLKPNFPEVTGEQLQSKYPELYASFKINVNENNTKEILKPNTWPENVCVRYFFNIPKTNKTT